MRMRRSHRGMPLTYRSLPWCLRSSSIIELDGTNEMQEERFIGELIFLQLQLRTYHSTSSSLTNIGRVAYSQTERRSLGKLLMVIQCLTNPRMWTIPVKHLRSQKRLTMWYLRNKTLYGTASSTSRKCQSEPETWNVHSRWNTQEMRDVSFDTHVDYRTIPPRQSHDYEYHDDNTVDESNKVDEGEDPYQFMSTVPHVG
jgi:hypothetical protein